MAEQEIIKNLENIYKLAESKEHSFWHKAKHIFVEIAIIVFAVSLSIGFHNWSESRHEQNEVKHFLVGLRKDLQHDAAEMRKNMDAYKQQKELFGYIASIPKGELAEPDSLATYKSYFFNYTGFGKSSGRYEGFKSSGKLSFIEEDDLQNAILDFYEEHIPTLLISTEFYKKQKASFVDEIIDNAVDFPYGNIREVLASERVKNKSKIYLSPSVDEILVQYQNAIDKIDEILKKIDHLYPEQSNKKDKL